MERGYKGLGRRVEDTIYISRYPGARWIEQGEDIDIGDYSTRYRLVFVFNLRGVDHQLVAHSR